MILTIETEFLFGCSFSNHLLTDSMRTHNLMYKFIDDMYHNSSHFL